MTPGSETDFTLSNARQFYMSIGGRGGGGGGDLVQESMGYCQNQQTVTLEIF